MFNYSDIGADILEGYSDASELLYLFEDSKFVIRYIPFKPLKADLEMLTDNLYLPINLYMHNYEQSRL